MKDLLIKYMALVREELGTDCTGCINCYWSSIEFTEEEMKELQEISNDVIKNQTKQL